MAIFTKEEQGQFTDILNEFLKRIRIGEDVHKKKFEEIRRSRLAIRQIMSADNQVAATMQYADAESEETKSKYLAPLHLAVAEKMIQEITTNNPRFEWEGNNKQGMEVAKAFREELLKVYTVENSKKSRNFGLWHLVASGTMISQTVTKRKVKQRIDPRTGDMIEPLDLGRVITQDFYDPLSTILDWNADPSDVRGTSNFAIVTIGYFDSAYIKEKYNIDLVGSSFVAEDMDLRRKNQEVYAGHDKREHIKIREYYRKDGKRYTILDDSFIVEVNTNENGVFGEIPINITPMFIDPDSPYGMTLHSLLEPSVEMISTAINQVADTNALNIKMPFFAIKGAIERGMTLDAYEANEIVELDASEIMTGSPNASLDINKMITKLSFPDVTQSAMFMFEQALNMIWFITGLNPTTLGGIQSKQIRTSDVAGMIQQSSLRNSSKVIVNLETYFMNPTMWDIVQIFDLYYKDFSFEEKGIKAEFIKAIKNVRVVNGSYLPADQIPRLQRISAILQRQQFNPNAYDAQKIEEEYLEALGVGDPEFYFKDPMAMFTEEQILGLMSIVQQGGGEAIQQFLAQQAQQMQQQEQ